MRLGRAQPLTPHCASFYFLRHGQTACNALRIFQTLDEPLNETGLEQAAQAARLLADEPIRQIVCSDARRVLQTAHIAAAPHHLEPMARAALRERNFGALIGTSSMYIDWAASPEGGETLAGFMQRKHAALADALALPGPVLVVAHGGTLYALAAMLAVPLDWQLLGNALPLRFERSGATWRATPLSPRKEANTTGIA